MSLQPVSGIGAVLALRQPELQQRPVQQLARIIAGERPAGAVGAMLARRKTRRSPARRPDRRTPGQAHSTSRDARRGIRDGKRPAAGTADSRAEPRPAGSATGRRGWRTALRCRRRAAVSGATQLYAIAIGSNRPHGAHGRPPQVVEAAIAKLDEQFGLFDASPILLNPAHGGAGRDFANAVALIESDLSPPGSAPLPEGARARVRPPPRPALGLTRARPRHRRVERRELARTRADHPAQSARERGFVLRPLASIAPGWQTRRAPHRASSRPSPCPPPPARLTGAALVGPLAQSVEQLTFNQ